MAGEPLTNDSDVRRPAVPGGVPFASETVLAAQLARWTAQGVISQAQADAIRVVESDTGSPALTRAAPTPSAAHPEPVAAQTGGLGRYPVLVEVCAYLGGLLVLAGVMVVLGQFWTELSVWAKLGVIVAVGATTGVAGWWLGTLGGAAALRLRSFLWVGPVAATAGAVIVGCLDLTTVAVQTATLIGAACALPMAVGLWRLRIAPLQQLATFGCVVAIMVAGMAEVTALRPEFVGLAIWGLGVAWAFAAWGRLVPPQTCGYVIFCVATMIGAQMFAANEVIAPLWLGIGTAAVLLGLGAWRREMLFVVFGAINVLIFVPRMLLLVFPGGAGAAVALVIVGSLLLAIALLSTRLLRHPAPAEVTAPAVAPGEAVDATSASVMDSTVP